MRAKFEVKAPTQHVEPVETPAEGSEAPWMTALRRFRDHRPYYCLYVYDPPCGYPGLRTHYTGWYAESADGLWRQDFKLETALGRIPSGLSVPLNHDIEVLG